MIFKRILCVRKKCIAIAAVMCASLAVMTSQAQADSIPQDALPSPAVAVPTATPLPEATPTPHVAPKAGNPDLSGHIDYTLDPVAVRDDLKQIGIDTIPAHFHPFLQLTLGGLEFLTLNRDGNMNGTLIYIMVVQDADELTAKLHALARVHLQSLVNPIEVAHDPQYKCTQPLGYNVGSIAVRELSCASNSTNRLKMEFATIPNGQIPIMIYGQSRGTTFDEAALRQLITQINAEKSP